MTHDSELIFFKTLWDISNKKIDFYVASAATCSHQKNPLVLV